MNTSQALDALLSRWYERPSTEEILGLIHNGVTEEDIIRAGEQSGYMRPNMQQTLQELEFILPHLMQARNSLRTRHGDRHLLYLGRDAELLDDVDATLSMIEGHERESAMLPGSKNLWASMRDTDPKMLDAFLQNYHLDKHAICSSQRPLQVDSGFVGTVGYLIWRTLAETYGAEISDMKAKVPIELISAAKSVTHGPAIMKFRETNDMYNRDVLPKVSKILGYSLEKGESEHYGYDRLAYRICISLQVMPHFHDTYDHLERKGSKVIAMPARSTRPDQCRYDVDAINENDEAEGRNASVVNPVAAMTVQYRVVKACLSQTENSC